MKYPRPGHGKIHHTNKGTGSWKLPNGRRVSAPPIAEMAKAIGMTEEEFLETTRSAYTKLSKAAKTSPDWCPQLDACLDALRSTLHHRN